MRSELVRARGASLTAFSAGADELPTVLFVNAVGMGGALLEGVASDFLAAGLNLLTWELRGSPGPADPRSRLSVHVADGLAVLNALGGRRVHVAGWCTGASIALFIGHKLGDRALSFASIDGAYLFDGMPGGPLGNALFSMCKEIAADTGRGAHFYEITRPRGNEAVVLGLDGHAGLARQLTLPYRQGPDGLSRYAFAMLSVCDYDPAPPCANLALPALFTARRDDRMMAHRNSLRAAELAGDAEFFLAESGGHYGLFTDRMAVPRLAEFMQRAEGTGHWSRARNLCEENIRC